MNRQHGIARDQIEFPCLDDWIGKDMPFSKTPHFRA